MLKNYHLLFSALALIALSACSGRYTNQELQEILQDKSFDIRESSQGVIINLPQVFFEFDSKELTNDARAKISELASIFNNRKGMERNLLIEGHTDALGNDEYNKKLSLERAQMVASELAFSGVHQSRMDTKGAGKNKPLYPNYKSDGSDNPEGRKKNRRVEIIILNQ